MSASLPLDQSLLAGHRQPFRVILIPVEGKPVAIQKYASQARLWDEMAKLVNGYVGPIFIHTQDEYVFYYDADSHLKKPPYQPKINQNFLRETGLSIRGPVVLSYGTILSSWHENEVPYILDIITPENWTCVIASRPDEK